MMIGAFAYRLPPNGWRPDGWTAPAKANAMISTNNVHLDNAHRTPQFWLIWWVLCLNVSAGIGVIGMASPMLQEIFAGKLIGLPDIGFNALSVEQKATIAAIAAGFTGLLSLFNIGGRFFWASLSDKIGRKNTYYTFFILGIVLYALAPTFAVMGSKLLFVLGFGIILSMYGGGFATVPAYLADMFGTQFVGAIHGRLLTAWSTAGIIGPVVVNYIREFQLAAGVPRDQLYNTTMYILCAMLVAGLICNYLIKPVDPKWHMSEAEVAKLQAATATAGTGPSGSFGIDRGGLDGKGRSVLGLCRHSARMGCLGHAAERGQDLLIFRDHERGTVVGRPRHVVFASHSTKKDQGDLHASHFCLSCRRAARRGQSGYRFGPDRGSGACRDHGARRRKAVADQTDRREAQGDEGQMERQQGQAESLPRRGEEAGPGRRRPLVLHRRLHEQELRRPSESIA